MAKAIVDNMERERDGGNLELGQVGETKNENPRPVVQKVEPIIMNNESNNNPVIGQIIETVSETIVTESEAVTQAPSAEELSMDDIPRF